MPSHPSMPSTPPTSPRMPLPMPPHSFFRSRTDEPRAPRNLGRSATTGSILSTSTALRRELHDNSRFQCKKTSTPAFSNTIRHPVPPIIKRDKTRNYKRLAHLPSFSKVKVPEVTHLEVEAKTFFEALIRDSTTVAAITDATSTIMALPEFQMAWNAYCNACKRHIDDEGRGKDRYVDWSQIFVDLVNMIIESSPPSLNSLRTLNLEFRAFGSDDDSEASSVADLECAGVLKETSSDGTAEWGNILILIHVGLPQSKEAEASSSSSRSDTRRRGGGTALGANPAKRRRLTATLPLSPNTNTPHSQSSNDSTDKDPLSREVFETMCALGNRRHLFSITADGLALHLKYYDRAGSVRTNQLDVATNIDQIIQIFIAFSLCDASQLGLEPLFHSDSPSFGSVIGTEVIVDGHRFRIETVQHLARSLYGRGTAVYAARTIRSPLESGGTHDKDMDPIPDVVIVKLSWQPATQELEDELYKIAARSGVEGISTLYASSSPARLSEGIRGSLCQAAEYCDRELRVQIMGPLCIPLYKVADQEHFKSAFRSLVKAHHDLYEKAGILHRDISINNLMADPSRPGVGVLIDLDLAIRVAERPTSSVNVAGTIPFLAIDLLRQQPPPPHYYRHDLESFLYVLAWIIFHYVDGEYVPSDELRMWYEGTWNHIASIKLGFLSWPGYLWSDSETPPSTLVESWLEPLGDLFRRGYKLRVAKRRKGLELEEDESFGGEVTFMKFMDVLSK